MLLPRRNSFNIISWSMAAILGNSSVAVVVRTYPRAIPLAMLTMRKSIHGFAFLSYMSMGPRLVAFWTAGAPLLLSSPLMHDVASEFACAVRMRRNVERPYLEQLATLKMQILDFNLFLIKSRKKDQHADCAITVYNICNR